MAALNLNVCLSGLCIWREEKEGRELSRPPLASIPVLLKMRRAGSSGGLWPLIGERYNFNLTVSLKSFAFSIFLPNFNQELNFIAFSKQHT